MNKLIATLVLALGLASASASEFITLNITVTNATANGAWITINGFTRSATNYFDSTHWQATNTTPQSASNLFKHLGSFPIQSALVSMSSETNLVIKGMNLTFSVDTNYFKTNSSSQTITPIYAFQYPGTTLPAVISTNQASEFVLQLPKATNALAETTPAMSNFVSRGQAQFLGNKRMTNSWFDYCSVTNTLMLGYENMVLYTYTNAGFAQLSMKYYESGDWYDNLSISNMAWGFYENPYVAPNYAYSPQRLVHGQWLTNCLRTNLFNTKVEAGLASSAGADAVAVGKSANGGGVGAIAIGLQTTATAGDAIAIGDGADAQYTNAVALGAGAVAGGYNSVALGPNVIVNVQEAVGIGFGATPTTSNMVAIGGPQHTTYIAGLLSSSNQTFLNPIWDDVLVQMFTSGRTNAYLPDIIPVDNGGMIYSYGFITNRVAYGNVQMPHGLAWTNSVFPSLYVEPHVHISLSNAPAGGATNVTFHLEYQWGNISGSYSNVSGAVSNTIGLMSANTHYLLNFGHITNNAAVSNLSSVLRMRLTRGASAANVFPGNQHVILDAWDVHVPRMRNGSLGEDTL